MKTTSNTLKKKNLFYVIPLFFVLILNNSIVAQDIVGKRIVVQDETNGGPNKGIFMWKQNDPTWGIYMGSPVGNGKTLSNETLQTLGSVTSHAIRFRANLYPQNGFIFENRNNTPLVAFSADEGNAWFNKGKIFLGEEATLYHDLTLLMEDGTNKWKRIGADSDLAFWADGNAEVNNLPNMIIKSNGNVGIGFHANVEQKFAVNGTAKVNNLIVNHGGHDDLAQVAINTEVWVDDAALTVAGGLYVGPRAELAAGGTLDRFEPSYLDEFKLWVEDGIITEKYRISGVEDGKWRDFVFEADYDLPDLEEVDNYIQKHGHLKDVPSAKEVEENGYELVDMDAILLQKIEELTLYTLEQQKEIVLLKKAILEHKK